MIDDLASEPNPFQPPDDEQVFKMREEDRRRKHTQREKLRKMKVWEKTTQSSRMGRTRRIADIEARRDDGNVSRQAKHTRGLVAAATAAISQDRRREKENMADFIAKKREMFLVQMSLDTKREEIRKLEQKAHMKEEALKKSELMLEEDAIRFDAFLKENDKKAHEAIKNAEREAKLKTDKMQEIKRLKHSIHVVANEKSKCEEALRDCLKYKEFLDQLTPPEWVRDQKEQKKRRQEERRVASFEHKRSEWESLRDHSFEQARRQEEEARKKALREGRVLKQRPAPTEADLRLPPKPSLDDEELVSSGEEMPMYFQHPQQLLDIFTQLEEGNLFLIQNCQETEQQLEELKQTYRETERKMQKQTQALQDNIEVLKAQIDRERAKANSLKERVKESSGEDGQAQLLKALRNKVKQVYKACGKEPAADPDTLSMLTELEALLESLLSEIASMRPEYVVIKEREKEKQRRDKLRLDRLAQQQQIYEQRLKKSMERSQAPAKKKLGKQVMFRSPPLRKRVKTKKRDTKADQEAADLVYLT